MRETVRSGTATVVDLPGTPVGAKTGTAEIGTATPPKTHAWLIGYRGDLAFAVLVEEGDSGSHTAGPVARQFLEAVTR
jgi:cell division protein FtsI/penicillin-binding protein 2